MQGGNGNVAGAAPAAALPTASATRLKTADLIQNLQAFADQSEADLAQLRYEVSEATRKLFVKTKEAEEMVLCSVLLLPAMHACALSALFANCSVMQEKKVKAADEQQQRAVQIVQEEKLQLQVANQQLQQANQELQQAKQQLEKEKQQLQQANQELQQAKQQLEQEKQQMHQANQQLEQEKQQVPQLQQQLTDKTTQLQQSMQHHNQTNTQLRNVQKELEDTNAKLVQMQTDMTETTRQLTEAQQQAELHKNQMQKEVQPTIACCSKRQTACHTTDTTNSHANRSGRPWSSISCRSTSKSWRSSPHARLLLSPLHSPRHSIQSQRRQRRPR